MTASSDLRALLAQRRVRKQGQDGALACEALSLLRRAPLYDADLPLKVGGSARAHLHESSVEYWDVMEQIVLAAADRGVWDVVRHLGNDIRERFQDSWRVAVLNGRRNEVFGYWDKAMKIYMDVVERNPLCGSAYKRQIAVLKSQRKVAEAVAMLNYYVSIFAGDSEAWAELCSLCMELGRMEHALFAANELILLNKEDYAAHILVADIHMTIGGFQNLLSARRHYCYSLATLRKGKTLRALLGLLLAATRLREENKWKEVTYSEGYDITEGDDEKDEEVGESDTAGGGGPGEMKGDVERGALLSPKDRKAENDNAILWAQEAIQAMYASVARNSGTASEGSGDKDEREKHVAYMQKIAGIAFSLKS